MTDAKKLSRHEAEARRVRDAHRALQRLDAEADVLGRSSMVRMATRIGGRFKAEDVDQADPIEVWGARIGRMLSLIGFVVLLIYLVWAYGLH